MKAASKKYKRINISIPVETLRLLDEIAPQKKRSRFIADAIEQHVSEIKRLELRGRLKAGYLANAESDRQIAEEWFPVEQEVYEKYVKDEGESN